MARLRSGGSEAQQMALFLLVLAMARTAVRAGSKMSELEAELLPLKVSELISRMRKAEFTEAAIDLALDHQVGLGRIVALYYRSSSLYRNNRLQFQCLDF